MTRDQKKIDDLGFRVAWLETIVRMNIERLELIAGCKLAPADDLRKAAADLAEDTRKDLEQLQIKAVERLLVTTNLDKLTRLTAAGSANERTIAAAAAGVVMMSLFKSESAPGYGSRGGCAAFHKQPRTSRFEEGAAGRHTRRFFALLATLTLASCGAAPISTVPTNNPGISAGLIAIVDGCRLFRINDNGRSIYFANCGGGSARMQWSEPCGKNCSREVVTLTEQSILMGYQQPPGISLLFCSPAEIMAAPPEEREAYYRIVDGLVADPEAFGFRRETTADLDADAAVDRRLGALNDDWTAP